MKRGTVKSTVIWQWSKEERRKKSIARVKKFFGWLLLILVLNAVGWVLGSLMVSIR